MIYRSMVYFIRLKRIFYGLSFLCCLCVLSVYGLKLSQIKFLRHAKMLTLYRQEKHWFHYYFVPAHFKELLWVKHWQTSTAISSMVVHVKSGCVMADLRLPLHSKAYLLSLLRTLPELSVQSLGSHEWLVKLCDGYFSV